MKSNDQLAKLHSSHCWVLFSFLVMILFSSCQDQCEVETRFINYQPVYQPMAEVRASFEVMAPRSLGIPGKIYYYNGFLLINEPNLGVHIIDNHDPAAPQFKSFVSIPGNFDMAVSGNMLYADRYTDLVVIDITDPVSPKEIYTVENVFPNFYQNGLWVDSTLGVVIDYVEIEETRIDVVDCDYPIYFGYAEDAAAIISSGGDQGVGGSTARFTANGDFLYTVDTRQMRVFDIHERSKPEFSSQLDLAWGIETIFPYRDNLFLGAMDGMHIYDISVPGSPSYISTFSHATGCDPVVVENDYAYVTLRAGNFCGSAFSQLNVIDVADLFNPTLVKTYPMQNPYGLGIDKGTLFICEGDLGLKVYDATDVLKITDNQLANFSNVQAFDVIPLGGVLMVTGADGLYQYDYSDQDKITILSIIPTGQL